MSENDSSAAAVASATFIEAVGKFFEVAEVAIGVLLMVQTRGSV